MAISSRTYWCVGLGVLVVVGVGVGIIALGRSAEIEGDTPAERIKSICRLADEQPRGAGQAIAAAAGGDADASVRCAAMVALGRFIESEHRPTIEAGLTDKDGAVRAAAAATLGLYADEPSVDKLGELLASQTDMELRVAAARGLGVSGHSKAIVRLLQTAEAPGDSKVRSVAMDELVQKFKWRSVGGGPENLKVWRNRIESVKCLPQVQQAFRDASCPLVRHADHIDSTHD